MKAFFFLIYLFYHQIVTLRQRTTRPNHHLHINKINHFFLISHQMEQNIHFRMRSNDRQFSAGRIFFFRIFFFVTNENETNVCSAASNRLKYHFSNKKKNWSQLTSVFITNDFLVFYFTLRRCYVKRVGLTFTRCNRSNWKVLEFGSEASEGKNGNFIDLIYFICSGSYIRIYEVFFCSFNQLEQLCGAQLLDVLNADH